MGRSGSGSRQGDLLEQALGVIGALAVAYVVLALVKNKLGLSWPAMILAVAAILLILSHLTWKGLRSFQRARGKAALALKEAVEGPPAAEVESRPRVVEGRAAEDVSDTPTVPSVAAPDSGGAALFEGALVSALRQTAAIGAEETVSVTTKQAGQDTAVYDVVLPPGRTQEEVTHRLGRLASHLGVTRLHLKVDTSRASERQLRLLVLTDPPFTSSYPPPTREEIKTCPGVALGHEINGQLWSFRDLGRVSLLISGLPQAGKTTLLNDLMTCMVLTFGAECDLYVLDGEMYGLSRFEGLAVRYEASGGLEVMESMLDDLNWIAVNRSERAMEAYRSRIKRPDFRPVFFIVDECADFFESEGSSESKEAVQRIEGKIGRLAAKSSEYGISVILATRQLSRETIPLRVRSKFRHRACMYVETEGAVKAALGDSYFDSVAPISPVFLDPAIKGQVVLYVDGASTLIQSFNFPEEFVWAVVDEAVQRRGERIPDSPLNRAVGILEARGVGFMAAAELAPLMGIESASEDDRGKRLGRLLGVPEGQARSVAHGYWLKDLQGAATAARE
ncbi:FtsK/SpoIIIE domain-containing protein [Streptomyces sp. MNP-20]|uniref:FtsK/SpoIIIE domain-containing protein n=1 Tax=Streptomyces sp. MNP-20 TaxID=2721165 RepID=UPI001551EA1E|nr:FtsK/SpoIIIE domain-containing protein [Streptomyces sp. MNP-20]